jgi:hypothetical protein
MAPLINGTAFVGIVGIMLFTLTSLHAIAKHNSSRRIKKTSFPSANAGAKIISLPQNVVRPLKEGSVTTQSVVQKETV